MHFRKCCPALALVISMSAPPGIAATLTGPFSQVTVASSECPGGLCFQGPGDTAGIVLWQADGLPGRQRQGEAFMTYIATSNALGIYAAANVTRFARNGTVSITGRDVFTVGALDPAMPLMLDIQAVLAVSGLSFIGENADNSQARITSRLSGALPTTTGFGGSAFTGGTSETTSVILGGRDGDTNRPNAQLITHRLVNDITIEVGVPFQLQASLELVQILSWTTGGSFVESDFGNSALISFELPEGYFITSELGYSQGLTVIPLPASGLLLLSAFGVMGSLARLRGRAATAS